MTNVRTLFIIASISLSSVIFHSQAQKFEYPTLLQSAGFMLMTQGCLLKKMSSSLLNNGYANIELPKGPSFLRNVASMQKFSRASVRVGLLGIVSPLIFKAAEQLGIYYRK